MKKIAVAKEYEGLVKEICALSSTLGLDTVFTTFLELLATGFAVYFDPSLSEKMRKRFAEIEGALSEQVKQAYSNIIYQMFICSRKYREEPQDILGEVFHFLGLHNEWAGQFFTPNDVGRLLASLVGLAESSECIEDPACGAGALLFACARNIAQHGGDYKNVLFIGTDIDIRCVWMTYIQCCLFGLPAKIKHGNSLTNEVGTEWHTLGYWNLVGKKIKGDSFQVCE